MLRPANNISGTDPSGRSHDDLFPFHALYFCRCPLAILASWPIRLDGNARAHLFSPYLSELLQVEKYRDIPWRYVRGRILKRKPVCNFGWATARRVPRSLSAEH